MSLPLLNMFCCSQSISFLMYRILIRRKNTCVRLCLVVWIVCRKNARCAYSFLDMLISISPYRASTCLSYFESFCGLIGPNWCIVFWRIAGCAYRCLEVLINSRPIARQLLSWILGLCPRECKNHILISWIMNQHVALVGRQLMSHTLNGVQRERKMRIFISWYLDKHFAV